MSRSLTPLTDGGIGGLAGAPVISATSVFHITRILSLANRRSCRIFSERNESRRCTTVTDLQICDR
ncbi:hypothetical protein D3C72_2345320 [compost metagenome]